MRLALRCLLLMLTLALGARAEDRLAFVGVALDLETRQADRKLQELLVAKAGVSFAPEELEYEEVIKRLSNAKAGEAPFLARATPYVLVAAELLGADLEVLGTYVSTATGRTTYRSHFVVSRKAFPAVPDLAGVYSHLRQQRSRFAYHSAFSTSSFFLPSLYFREQKLFHMPENTESLWAIDAVRIQENSSSRLVDQVANGEADIAAVWDGTRAKAEKAGKAGAVHFVPLPTLLPNDLLVCSRTLDPRVKAALRQALQAMGPQEIAIGDFLTWRLFDEQTEARKALADLRWLARERTAPVTVEVRMAKGEEGHPEADRLLEAVRQAVRLSATELVPYDKDFHQHVDYAWSIDPVHDGALVLHSAVPGFDAPPQAFRLSYRGSDDLTRRLISVVHTRLHRIRTLWPYSSNPPIVLRDMALALPAGHVVEARRITWLDPERDKFRAGTAFRARIERSDYFRFELNGDDLKNGGGARDLDPLSNETFRVLLTNPQEERLIFRVLTAAMVLLLAGSAAASVFVWLRRRPEERLASQAGGR